MSSKGSFDSGRLEESFDLKSPTDGPDEHAEIVESMPDTRDGAEPIDEAAQVVPDDA